MITDADVKKLKQTFVTKEDLKRELNRFATKEDLEDLEIRTALGFTDTQKQISAIKSDTAELKTNHKEIKGEFKVMQENFKDVQQQMRGMEENIIRAINGIKEEQEIQKKQIEKINKAVFSN